MKHLWKSSAVAVCAIALMASGCSSKEKTTAAPESSGTATPSDPASVLRIKDKGVTAKGGTVRVLLDGDFDSLDPADNYITAAQEVGRLIYRSLTFINDVPGGNASIQPDLAEGLGVSTDDGRTWTYKLRAGVKYEDGRPITAQDVKYGVMRSFESDVFTLGATWMPDLLANEAGFEGPYATPDKDLSSVETPDDRTLIFHFNGPQPDADWIMSLPYTAPVPKDKDTKLDYANRPMASGPYKIEQYVRGTSLTLVRNENWDPRSDPNRPAYPDRFQFDLTAGENVSQRLLDGKGDDANGIPLGGGLKVADFPKSQDPSVKPRFINGPGSCVENITMNTQKLTDRDVRHAIALAIDRQRILAISGGELMGSIVDSVISPDIAGYAAPDLGLKPNGDPEAAKKLLKGKSVPRLRFGISDTASGSTVKEAEQIQADLKGVGIEMVLDRHPDEELSAVLDGNDAPELAWGAWCADWPTAASIVLPLLGPNTDGTSWGSSNAAKYFDPKFSGQLQALRSSTDDSAAIAKKVVDITNQIQATDWPYLPTIHDNDPEVVGANVTNVGISPVFGEVDLNTLAVRK
jgi:peptide/nickel transport system substrate-binding protein